MARYQEEILFHLLVGHLYRQLRGKHVFKVHKCQVTHMVTCFNVRDDFTIKHEIQGLLLRTSVVLPLNIYTYVFENL